MSDADISVCMITYNKSNFLPLSIPAISDSISMGDRVEFIVLDNGSTDGTSDVLWDLSRNYNIKTHRVDTHLGLNAYSVATSMATGKVIITADDDIFYVSPGWEDMFMGALFTPFNGKFFGYVGADTVNTDGGRVYHKFALAEKGDIKIEVGPVGGWFTATTRTVMSEVGGFHSGMPLMYLEDADYQSRVAGAGFLYGTILNVRVYHARGPKFFKLLSCMDTYNERISLADEVGIKLEPVT